MKLLIPAYFTTDATQLRQTSKSRTAFGQPGLIEIALPLHFKGTQEAYQNCYVTTPLDDFLSPQKNEMALGALKFLHLAVTSRMPEERLAVWESLARKRLVREEQRKLWSLMLILWAFQENPEAYFKGNVHLADAFADYLQISGFPKAYKETVFYKYTVGVERAVQRCDLKFVIESRWRHEDRLRQLGNMKKHVDAYMKVWMILFGLLTGVTEILILDLLLEGFIGYVLFMSDLHAMEEDGEITPDEEFGSWISFAGIFFPFIRILPKGAGMAVSGGMILALVTLLVRTMIQVIQDLIQSIERLLAAMEIDVETYAEQTVGETLFIPVGE